VGTLGLPQQHHWGQRETGEGGKGDEERGETGEGGKGDEERAQTALRRQALDQVGDSDGRALMQDGRELWTGGQGGGQNCCRALDFSLQAPLPGPAWSRKRWRRMTRTAPHCLNHQAELLLPGSTLAQIRSPGDPWGTFNLGQDSYWINTMNM